MVLLKHDLSKNIIQAVNFIFSKLKNIKKNLKT